MFLRLAATSLHSRRSSVTLTVLAMAVSVFVLLAVEHIRDQAKQSFAHTVSGADLIVGAKTGSINLLLYSIFRIGAPTDNISWQATQSLAENPQVEWLIPISLGDSHRGFRVMGTTDDYFKFYRYGSSKNLQFREGQHFEQIFDVVLGAEVAKKLAYTLGDELVLAHGLSNTSFSLHDDRPFTVVGILKPTGTPVDHTLHVSLQGLEAIHLNWKTGVKLPQTAADKALTSAQIAALDLTPSGVTACIVGLKSKLATFRVQREINTNKSEAMLAILPGVALSQLWQTMAILENTLFVVSVLVLIAALLGLAAMLMASIRERAKEIHLLRVIGASPVFLFFLIELEAMLIALLSMFLGVAAIHLSIYLIKDWLASNYGLYIDVMIASEGTVFLLVAIVLATCVAAALPSLRVYRNACV